ncbi:rod shape-determining protein MreC [bacterium]|nr:rod shape-determining protein MreC [bacterium]
MGTMLFTLPPETRNRLLAIAALGLCAFSVARPLPWQDDVRGAAHSVARPALAAFALAYDGLDLGFGRVRALIERADEVRRLRDENRALREALADQTDRARQLTGQLRSYELFEEFTDARLDRPLQVIAANVLAADTSTWRHSLVVNRGAEHGVQTGSPVVWGNSIVGAIVSVRPRAATVRLLTDGGAGLMVRIDRTGAVGFLAGAASRDGLLDLDWLDSEPAVKEDMVITSGQNPAIPSGFVAGTVVEAEGEKSPQFYRVKVRPLLDLHRLTEVLVVVYASGDVEGLVDEQAESAR